MRNFTFSGKKFFVYVTALLLTLTFGSKLNNTAVVSADEVQYIVNTDDLNVRLEADGDSSVLTVLDKGTVVTVTDKEGNYSKIIVPGTKSASSLSEDTEFAYVYSKYLTKGTTLPSTTVTASTSGSSSNSSSKGKQVVAYAKKFVGNPYRWGGTSLTKGADCSGFVQSVYKHFGKSLPRTSTSQRKVGTKVSSLKKAKAGDIICYSGHVAIYMGNNKIVHASTRKTGIKISNNAAYRKIVTIRRVFA